MSSGALLQALVPSNPDLRDVATIRVNYRR